MVQYNHENVINAIVKILTFTIYILKLCLLKFEMYNVLMIIQKENKFIYRFFLLLISLISPSVNKYFDTYMYMLI